MDTQTLFDTHTSVKKLIAAGLSETIAEALVEEQQKWHNSNLANLANKQDIALLNKDIEAVRKEIKQDVESLRKEVKQDFESLRKEIKHEFTHVDDRIESVRQETKQEFARIETRVDALGDQIITIKWLIGLMFAFNTFLFGLMVTLIKFL